MTVTRAPGSGASPSSDRHRGMSQSGAIDVHALCPYLAAEDGSWRAPGPDRDLRCTALRPASIVVVDKQRRLCATSEFPTCATFAAASAGGDRAAGGRWSLARTTPIVVDHGRLTRTVPALRPQRRGGQALLGALMAIAVVVVLAARFVAMPEAAGLGLDSPSPTMTLPSTAVTAGGSASAMPATPPASASPTVSPGPTLTPGPSATPAPVASSTPPAASPSFATYAVRSGDTLASIAGRFGTTARAIAQLNGIDDPRRLRIGQVLRIPPAAP